jgi:hypothetical protein
MPSVDNYAKRLVEEVNRKQAPCQSAMEEALRGLRNSLLASLDEFSPKIQVPEALELPMAEQVISDAVREMASRARAEMARVADFSRELLRQETQEDILALLLETSQTFTPFAVLFVQRGDHFVAWSSRGFSEESAGSIEGTRIEGKNSEGFQRLLKMLSNVVVQDLSGETALAGKLGKEAELPWFLVPMKAMNRVVAVLLAAGAPDRDVDPNALSILINISALYIETLALRLLHEVDPNEIPRPQAAEFPPHSIAPETVPPALLPQAAAQPAPEVVIAEEAVEAPVEPVAAMPLAEVEAPTPSPEPLPVPGEISESQAQEAVIEPAAAKAPEPEFPAFEVEPVIEGRSSIEEALKEFAVEPPVEVQGPVAPFVQPAPDLPSLQDLELEEIAELQLTEPAAPIPVPEPPAVSPDPVPEPEEISFETAPALPEAALPETQAPAPSPVPTESEIEIDSLLDAIGKPSPAAGKFEIDLSKEAPPAPIRITTPTPIPVIPAAAERKPSEEEKMHADARRFARLLVSEIKLYNEQRLAEGREKCDVYVRLKRDIDKSREMYEKRVPAMVARKFDYFNDEVVRILADNDVAKMGSDYPGSRSES